MNLLGEWLVSLTPEQGLILDLALIGLFVVNLIVVLFQKGE